MLADVNLPGIGKFYPIRIAYPNYGILRGIPYVIICTNLHIAEIPYVFRNREHGESKLNTGIVVDFASLILEKLTNGYISARFLLFCFVGLTGLAAHILFLHIGLRNHLKFDYAQTLSTVLIVAYNFCVNNILTYGDKRLRGKYILIGLCR